MTETTAQRYLTVDAESLQADNSLWTAREICQQPQVWREAYRAIDNVRPTIDQWLEPLLAIPELRIVLCGAGSSAFIGETLAPWLRKHLRRRVDAISTTDLVSDPRQYLAEDSPVLMISFARSGNSPESVASVNLANQVLRHCYHLVLTCNPQGDLAQMASTRSGMLCLLMPQASNDRSFAMTSSFSSMLVSCAALFAPDTTQLRWAAELAADVIAGQADAIKALAQRDFNRLVVLGAGCLSGTAREAALKCLELSAGEVVALFDTPLGFRHGPKSVVDHRTLIVHLQSNDAYIRLYDGDLLAELKRDNQAAEVVAIDAEALVVSATGSSDLEDIWLSLPYIVYCQMLAFFKARVLAIGADNPCPSGEVNRVVQGVTIHRYADR